MSPAPVPPCPGVRPARADDEERVLELWCELARHHARLDPVFATRPRFVEDARALLRRALGSGEESEVLVYDDGGPVAGFCLVRVDRGPALLAEPARAEITELVVEPARRRQGIARALVGAALRWVEARGVCRVEARVASINDGGQAFWRHLGFADFVDVLDRRL